MKLQNLHKTLALVLAMLTVFSVTAMTSCKQNETPKTTSSAFVSTETQTDSPWNDAIYTEDKTFGEGAKKVDVELVVADKSITFTVKTDKKNLADALLEHNLIEGENSTYGLYIKKVNGILADYNVDQSYWSLSKNGEALMTGASDTIITDGEKYEITYAK